MTATYENVYSQTAAVPRSLRRSRRKHFDNPVAVGDEGPARTCSAEAFRQQRVGIVRRV